MNLVLSSKAAKKLNKQLSLEDNVTSDINTWRVDCLSLAKRSVFLITNIKTLYTCASSYKSGFNEIIKKISSATLQPNLDIHNIYYIKLEDKSIVSTMNNMKVFIGQVDKYNPLENEEIERLINGTPFKYLSYRNPAEVHKSINL